jgi:hypothetical protein
MSQLWERQPIADSPLSVIVLLDKGDTEAVRQTLIELREILQELQRSSEILLPVSSDQEAVSQAAQAVDPHIQLVRSDEVGKGQGAALKAALAVAMHPLVFVLPVGYSAKYLPMFLKEIDLVDVVCGSRKSKETGWKRRQFFSVAYQIYGIWMQDPDCPMRLYRKEMFDRLPIQSFGSFAQIEILAKANFQSKLMTEVVIDGPTSDLARTSKDFWKVLNHPDFGKPPEKVVETPLKPIITTQAPEARA